MIDHVSIHVLTSYPPSNPNRDETGQPKTAVVGGKARQRISSQCIKRTWRLSDPIQQLDAPMSVRTRGLGSELVKILKEAGIPEKTAIERASKIAGVFGKVEKKRAPDHAEMVVYGHEEWVAALNLAKKIATENGDPTEVELAQLPGKTVSLDCAMFGRMRAAQPGLNVEAAVSVSHCLTVNQANIDSDFWTSVDDLKELDQSADQGSGGMGEVEYGSGVYYTYLDIDMNQLRKNLDGNADLAARSLLALIRAVTTTSPKGHRTTFGHHARAGFLRVEMGDSTGNLFCAAYETPVTGMKAAIDALRQSAEREFRAYGLKPAVAEMSVPDGQGTLAEIEEAVAKQMGVAA